MRQLRVRGGGFIGGSGWVAQLHVEQGGFVRLIVRGVPEFGTPHPARDYPSAPSVDLKHDRGNCAVGDVRDRWKESESGERALFEQRGQEGGEALAIQSLFRSGDRPWKGRGGAFMQWLVYLNEEPDLCLTCIKDEEAGPRVAFIRTDIYPLPFIHREEVKYVSNSSALRQNKAPS